MGPCEASMSSRKFENPFGLQSLRDVLQDELQAKYKNDDLASSIGRWKMGKKSTENTKVAG